MVYGFCHKCSQEVDCEATDSGDFRCSKLGLQVTADGNCPAVPERNARCDRRTCNSLGYVEVDSDERGDTRSRTSSRDAPSDGVPPLLRNGVPWLQEAMASAFRNFLQGLAGGLEEPGPGLEGIQRSVVGAVNNGVQRVIQNTQGLSEEDRQWIQNRGNQMTAMASGGINILRQAGPLANFLERHLGRNWQSQQSGLDGDIISRWLDERQIPTDSVLPGSGCPLGLKDNETWTCSICLTGGHDGCMGWEWHPCIDGPSNSGGEESKQPVDQEICLLCDSDGHTWHVFHKRCAKEWLSRSATCPLCRRSLHIT